MHGSEKALELLTCPVCGGDLSRGEVSPCAACETPMHSDCREFIGGCARFACEDAASPRGRLMQYLEAQLESGIQVWRSRLRILMFDRILPVVVLSVCTASFFHTMPVIALVFSLMVLGFSVPPVIDLLWHLGAGHKLFEDRARLIRGDLNRVTLIEMLQKALSDQGLEERSLRLITLWHSELLQVLGGSFVMGITPGDKKKSLTAGGGEHVLFLAPRRFRESPCPET